MGEHSVKADGIKKNRCGNDPEDPTAESLAYRLSNVDRSKSVWRRGRLFTHEPGSQGETQRNGQQTENDKCCAPTVVSNYCLGDDGKKHRSRAAAREHD